MSDRSDAEKAREWLRRQHSHDQLPELTSDLTFDQLAELVAAGRAGLTWTATPPAVAGWWWWKINRHDPPEVVEVMPNIFGGKPCVYMRNGRACEVMPELELWAGPIPAPQEPT